MLNKITNRILLGFSAPLAFLLLLGASIYASTENLIQLQRNSEETTREIQILHIFAYDLARLISSTRGSVLAPKDQAFRDAYISAREAMLKHEKKLSIF
ncbi:hypothetical protein DO97_16570 [Neosynechococcus sphagnicola sy1]|uniref:Uncharacterized protein n=1 Tax=Neosynechococcus sphagnicola sy1 TaxID=1497020 RepID=A0A098TP14_9CYAN|nr:hypothetical protein [Neosynechococcus sphagnicola]KGF73597.1 hypothetical protein DO97_16570 [Neosynechococcus sphagnicola sy1]